MTLPFRRTKILATVGPRTATEESLTLLVQAGVDAFRINFSHGTPSQNREYVERIRRVSERLSRPIPVVQDIQGPRLRVGLLPGGSVELRTGSEVLLVPRERSEKEEVIPIPYDWLLSDVTKGATVLLDDGTIELRVEDREGGALRARVVHGGRLRDHKGVNLPSSRLSARFPTEKDKADLRLGQDLGVEWVAVSFVRSAADIARVRAELDDSVGSSVLSKIELHEAVENIEEIVQASDAVMVARGDLGVEFPPEEVPWLQRRIVSLCDELGVPVVTATQMLESMTRNPRPTRAEVTDVFDAVLEGTSALMLSGETAMGEHPVEAVRTMDRIARRAEEAFFLDPDREERIKAKPRPTPDDSIAHATVQASKDVGAAAIIVLTESGRSAQLVSKYRPKCPILAFTSHARVARKISLFWGVEPRIVERASNEEELLSSVGRWLLSSGRFSKEDLVVLTSGKFRSSGSTNSLKIVRVGSLVG